jgi:TonB family protein
MKRLFVLICLLKSILVESQVAISEYYADKWLSKIVKPKQAAYIKNTFYYEDGTTCLEVLHQSGVIFKMEKYLGKEPIGTWLVSWGQGYQYLQYDFDLVYRKGCLDTLNYYDFLPKGHDAHKSIDSIGYEAPIPSLLPLQLTRKIVKPPLAIEEKASGTIVVGYRLLEDGTLTDFHIIRGIHTALDKEAIRVVRQLTYQSPPMLNGKALSVCTNQQLNIKAVN